MVSVVRRVRGCQAMPQCPTKGQTETDGRREGEKAVDESQKGTTRALEEPSKRRQHSGICGRKPRLPVVRPSPVDKSRWAATLANDHRPSPLHLGSIESWCNADPPTPRWHTPLTLVRGQALRWTPSSTPNRKSVLVRNKYRPRAMALFSAAAELPRTIRETACLQACKPASSARPTVEPAPWRKRPADAGRKKVRRLLQRLGLYGRRMAGYRP
ncbi:hypothetical protein GGI42DRAFT_19379 [Trichoderma sp. SZMC 28013]